MQKQQKVKKIAVKKYDEEKQSLDLQAQSKIWTDVLVLRDWSMLKVLSLVRCEIGENISALFQLNWPQLTNLNLYANRLTDREIKKLVEKDWPKLDALDLADNTIKDKGLLILLQKFHSKLAQLGIDHCSITKKGMKTFVEYSPKNIRKLKIYKNMIGNKGIKLLTKSDMPYLQQLHINENEIGNQGIKHIVKSNWPKLNLFSPGYLEYDSNKLRLDSFQSLCQNNWGQLRVIFLGSRQAVSWISLVTMQTTSMKMFKYGFLLNRKDQEQIYLNRNYEFF